MPVLESNDAKEKLIRTQANILLLFRHVRKGEF